MASKLKKLNNKIKDVVKNKVKPFFNFNAVPNADRYIQELKFSMIALNTRNFERLERYRSGYYNDMSPEEATTILVSEMFDDYSMFAVDIGIGMRSKYMLLSGAITSSVFSFLNVFKDALYKPVTIINTELKEMIEYKKMVDSSETKMCLSTSEELHISIGYKNKMEYDTVLADTIPTEIGYYKHNLIDYSKKYMLLVNLGILNLWMVMQNLIFRE